MATKLNIEYQFPVAQDLVKIFGAKNISQSSLRQQPKEQVLR